MIIFLPFELKIYRCFIEVTHCKIHSTILIAFLPLNITNFPNSVYHFYQKKNIKSRLTWHIVTMAMRKDLRLGLYIWESTQCLPAYLFHLYISRYLLGKRLAYECANCFFTSRGSPKEATKVFSYFLSKDPLERKVECFGTLKRLREISRNMERHAASKTLC